MTENELYLFDIAKNVISENSHISAMLSGSLMLAYRRIKKRREATDIDILVHNIDLIKVPLGFKQRDIESEEEYEESDLCRFYKNSDGINLEFFLTKEQPDISMEILLGSVKTMLDAKYEYWYDNGNDKHFEDLKFLNYNFPK